MICLSCGAECQTAHHWDGAKSYKEWICGDCKVKELTDRLAQVERERDELKRWKSCDSCENTCEHWMNDRHAQHYKVACSGDFYCSMHKPRDPSAEQGGELKMFTDEHDEVYEERYRLRIALAAARKWAKLWKMQATGERIQKEQAAKAYCDEATNRELLQESNNTLRAEIEQLNGRRCKDCKKSNDYLGGDTVYCNKQYAPVIVMGDHYCKSWEKR